MTIFHMKQSIAGCLRNNRIGTIDFLEDSKGNPLSDTEARIALNKLLAKGHTVMPVGDDCEGFDVFGGGCPGHEPLEGSDLCRKMLARGDKAVMCIVGTLKQNMVVVTRYENGCFYNYLGSRCLLPTPINNQGEPLTANEIGL